MKYVVTEIVVQLATVAVGIVIGLAMVGCGGPKKDVLGRHCKCAKPCKCCPACPEQ